MSNHTPGPWHIVGSDPMYGILADNGRSVALEYGGIDDIANAHLIAAAPDMLDALEDIVARNEIQHWFNLDKTRAAIAKARGQQ